MAQDIRILPPPQHMEKLLIRPALAPPVCVQPTEGYLTVAWELLHSTPDLKVIESSGDVVLRSQSLGARPSIELNFLAHQLLAEWLLHEQDYGLHTTANRTWVIGGGRYGVLYGAAFLAQLLRLVGAAAETTSVDLRVYPAFSFREGSDWLLNIEIKRWDIDFGRAGETYSSLVGQKLDRAARFKLNMVLVDGFGWSGGESEALR